MIMVLCWIAKFRIKLKYVLAALCLITVAFIIRQITWLEDLTEDYVRGVHVKQARFYAPIENGKFQCLTTGDFIDFVKVNDDYCDCEDGTDEPGTDACPNGKFYCKVDEYKRKAAQLPAGQVNDGICDCCDGSDEWKNDRSKASVVSRSGPCPIIC